MGEGSAHSEHYFATAYLAKVEGSAHSGCYCARNAKGRRGQRPCGVFATGHLAMKEGSAHWECYFAEDHQGWVRAARIGSITLPREGCRVPRAARIRIVTRRRNTKEKLGQRAFGVLFCGGMRRETRAARIRGVAFARDT